MAKRHGYRSDFELQLAKKLADRGVEFRYEARKFEYIPDPRNYTPDFYFPDLNLYIEAKGELTKADRVKHLLIKKAVPGSGLAICFCPCE
jgi:Phage endonuclease I.